MDQKQFKFIWLLQPLLIAVYPVIKIFAGNPEEVSFLHFLIVSTVIIIATVFSFLLFSFFYKSYFKSLVLLNFLILLFYGLPKIIHPYLVPLSKAFFEIEFFGMHIFRVRYIVLFILIISICLAHKFLVQKLKRDFFLKILLLPIVFLISSSVYSRITATKTVSLSTQKYDIQNNKFRANVLEQLKKSKSHNKRDIYFIILDSYPRQDYLLKTWNFDNSNFINELKKRGFYVADKSISNYEETQKSLGSSLNLNFIPKDIKPAPLMHMWNNNNITFFLKKLDYRHIHLSGYSANKKSKSLIEEIKLCLFDYYHLGNIFITHHTPLYDVLAGFYNKTFREHINNNIKKLGLSVHKKSPKFVFMHILIPHPPHVFDRDGNVLYLDTSKSGPEKYKFGCLEEIRHINKKILEPIDYVLKNSKTKPIILLQGDHGVAKSGPERFDILNAQHLPDGGDKLLYKNISPVNNFRVILNYYFGTTLELLEDVSFG